MSSNETYNIPVCICEESFVGFTLTLSPIETYHQNEYDSGWNVGKSSRRYINVMWLYFFFVIVDYHFYLIMNNLNV